MRVLWVCNTIPLPAIAEDLRVPVPVVGGWLTGLATELKHHSEVELTVCFPLIGISDVVTGCVDGVAYYAFPTVRRVPFLDVIDEVSISRTLKRALAHILHLADPEILHVFGTEYAHALVATRAFSRPERTVVSIQGLTSVYARHFLGSLPEHVHHRPALSSLVRGSLVKQAAVLERRGELEIETLRLTGHVSGRTDWDLACTSELSPTAVYHHCDEALRPAFYEGTWDLGGVDASSIFMTQGSSPVKGLYTMLEALPQVLHRFPDAHLFVAGTDPTKASTVFEWARRSAYGSYLADLIRELDLTAKVTFLGPLSENEMRDRLLRAHVFVSASSIENSSNALCEAQLLGVPVVSSFVGGIPSLLTHGADGYAYPPDAPYMLAHYIAELFAHDDVATRFSRAARERAGRRHDRQAIGDRQAEIYRTVLTAQRGAST